MQFVESTRQLANETPPLSQRFVGDRTGHDMIERIAAMPGEGRVILAVFMAECAQRR